MPGQVADVQAPRQRQRYRNAFEPQRFVRSEQLGQPLATVEEQRAFLPTHTGHRHDRHAGIASQLDVPHAAVEVDRVTLPRGPEDLVVPAGIDQQRCAGFQCHTGIFVVGGDGAELAQPAQRRRRDDEVMGQLVERPLDAEVGAEREGEYERVGRHVAAAVVADE